MGFTVHVIIIIIIIIDRLSAFGSCLKHTWPLL